MDEERLELEREGTQSHSQTDARRACVASITCQTRRACPMRPCGCRRFPCLFHPAPPQLIVAALRPGPGQLASHSVVFRFDGPVSYKICSCCGQSLTRTELQGCYGVSALR